MSWIGLSGRHQETGALRGVRLAPDRDFSGDALLARGTLVFEIGLSPDSLAPTRIIHHECHKGWQRQFTVFLNADFSLSVLFRQGQMESYVRLSSIRPRDRSTLRVTYRWEAPERRGLLSVEDNSEGLIRQVAFSDPIPMPMRDAHQIISVGPGVAINPRVSAIALADTAEPVGPSGTIASSTPIETTEGFRPVETLRLGDKVITRDHGVQPVRWLVSQTLPACGGTMPLSLRAPYFGLSRDLTLAAHQKLVLGGPNTEYLLGRDGVLVEAQTLSGHPAVAPEPTPLAVTFHQVLFDKHVCINAGGAWISSLFIGSLSCSPRVLATTPLASVPPSLLPIHRRMACPPLRSYETPVLRDVLPA